MSHPTRTPYPRPAGGRTISAAERLHTMHQAARPTTPAPKFLTVVELATRARVSKMTIYRLFHEGALDGAVRVGRSIRIPETTVESILKAGTDVSGAIDQLRKAAVND